MTPETRPDTDRVPRPPKTEFLSKKEIGRRLRELRKTRGLSQVELAAALGTYQTTVSAIERGARGMTLQQAVKLAGVLGASPDDLLARNDNGRNGTAAVKDRRFLRRLQLIEKLPKRDQQALLRTIDAFLSKVS